MCVRSTRFRPCPNYTAPGGYLLLERLLVGLVVRHLKRLDRPIVSAVKRPLTANRLQRWGRGARKHDVHLMDDALEAWAIVLAALCSDRHFSACSSFAKLQGEPIQLGLRRLSPGEDAEVHNEASILSEHDWKVGLFRHKGLFPASGREVTPPSGAYGPERKVGRDEDGRGLRVQMDELERVRERQGSAVRERHPQRLVAAPLSACRDGSS